MLNPLLAWSLLAGAASGETVETIEKSFTVTGPPSILVTNEDGRTEIRSHTESGVRLRVAKEVVGASSRKEAERLAHGVEVRIEQVGDRIQVQTIYPKSDWSLWHHARVLVHIEMRAPRRSSLDVSTADGPLTVSGFEGELRLSTEDGELSLEDSSGTIRASGEDGDVTLLHVEGDVEAAIEDGDLRIEGALSRLTAEAEDGDLEVRLAPDSRMSADWSIRTEDGSVDVFVPADFAADLDVDTADGSIDLDLPVTLSGELSEGRVQGSLNGGGHRLRVRAEDGSVRLSPLS